MLSKNKAFIQLTTFDRFLVYPFCNYSVLKTATPKLT